MDNVVLIRGPSLSSMTNSGQKSLVMSLVVPQNVIHRVSTLIELLVPNFNFLDHGFLTSAYGSHYCTTAIANIIIDFLK